MTFVSGRVEEGLGRAAEKKQKEEEDALEREKENEPEIDEPHGAAAIILIGNNMNMFQIISSKAFLCNIFSSLYNEYFIYW